MWAKAKMFCCQFLKWNEWGFSRSRIKTWNLTNRKAPGIHWSIVHDKLVFNSNAFNREFNLWLFYIGLLIFAGREIHHSNYMPQSIYFGWSGSWRNPAKMDQMGVELEYTKKISNWINQDGLARWSVAVWTTYLMLQKVVLGKSHMSDWSL